MTNWIKPAWYLTPQEFADIIVDSLEDNNYFKRNEKAHPSDIEVAFSTTASAMAHAIEVIGKKINQEQRGSKQAMMKPSDLTKNIIISSSDNIRVEHSTVTEGSDLGYLEHKYGKIKK